MGTVQKSQSEPADITNQLLVAIYTNQLAALQNSSPAIINTTALLQQAEYKAVVYNEFLFTDLNFSIIVSMITLFAKIWVINYGHQVNSPGSPYERAVKRQEAYSGVLVWKLGEIIDLLPFLLLIAVLMLGIFIEYVYHSPPQDKSIVSSILVLT